MKMRFLIVSNLESACDAARAGVGITLAFSYHVAESIKSGELTPLLQDFQPPPLPVSFVYSPIASCRSNCAHSWISPCRGSGHASAICRKVLPHGEGARRGDWRSPAETVIRSDTKNVIDDGLLSRNKNILPSITGPLLQSAR